MKNGRIVSVQRGNYKVLIDGELVNCKALKKLNEPPCVGDFVLVEGDVVREIQPRKNLLTRKAAGRVVSESQDIASNIDMAFIVTSLNQEFNLRRLERYFTFLALQNIPYGLILTKSDICEDISHFLRECEELNLKAPPICTSVVTGEGLDEIKAFLQPDTTTIFIGSSGVGKSSLINHLLGRDELKVGDISQMEDKGRHTTTHRELFYLPNGAAIIDSPGMREIALWSNEGEDTTWDDIETLAANCKFRSCTHKNEQGCAVQDAIKQGTLSSARLKSYEKIKREAARIKRRAK
ncbi:MAG: ribosome small subunit-dependent GTPase A [Defluviitaleaceae bacterium]|nr:ribosome small subunit-dependent GTPase A [Defluviitaleaceae bacterium]